MAVITQDPVSALWRHPEKKRGPILTIYGSRNLDSSRGNAAEGSCARAPRTTEVSIERRRIKLERRREAVGVVGPCSGSKQQDHHLG